jgi:hypothetical protein
MAECRVAAIVRDKLLKLVADMEKGIQTDQDTENYTVTEAVNDWLAYGTKKLDPGTVAGYRILADLHTPPSAQARDHQGRNHDEHDFRPEEGSQVRMTGGSPFGSRPTFQIERKSEKFVELWGFEPQTSCMPWGTLTFNVVK